MPKVPACLSFMMVLLISACYEPQEGCLDPNAVNYDVEADINANCTYPALSIAFGHNWGDTTFSYDATYLDENGEDYQIRFMGFFLRDFEVKLQENGEYVPISGKVNSVRLQNGMFHNYPEELVFVESRNFQSGMDSVIVFDPWTAIGATLGLEELSMADSSALPGGHPLNKRSAMSPSGDDHYYDYVISILPDTGNVDSQRWIYASLADTMRFEFMDERMFAPAMNADIIFDLYYDKMFEGFSKEMSDADIKEMWEGNIRDAIELREE